MSSSPSSSAGSSSQTAPAATRSASASQHSHTRASSPPQYSHPRAAAAASEPVLIEVHDDEGGGGGGESDSLRGIRETAEYKAAWDLELWKAVQAERFRKQLEKERAKAAADLARTVKAKEKEAAEEAAKRTEAVRQREARVERDAAAVAQQKTRLEDAERAVRRMRQQLLDAQRRVEEEVRAQVRRANEDLTHKQSLLQERVKAAEAQAQRAEERQRHAQADYLQIYEEFHKFRTQQLLAAPPSTTTHRGTGEFMEMDRLRVQHMEEMRVLRETLEQRHRAERAEMTQRCRELEEGNQKLVAALSRRRAQLHALREEKSKTTVSSSRAHTTTQHGGSSSSASSKRLQDAVGSASEIVRELDRLRRERAALVEGTAGAISEDDDVVRRVDARVVELRVQLSQLTTTSGRDEEDRAAPPRAVAAS